MQRLSPQDASFLHLEDAVRLRKVELDAGKRAKGARQRKHSVEAASA